MDLMFQKLGCMVIAAVFVAFVGYVLLSMFLSMGAYIETVLP